MKKKFLSAILFGALLASSTGTFVSCKDYDDDISSLQAKDSELSTQLTTQLSALQSALDAAKADIAAAKAEAAAAKAEAVAAAKDLADEAKAEAAAAKAEAAAAKADAAAAKEAAATAKAEAIEAAKAQVEEMLKDVATAAQVKELEARVAAIEGLGLSAEQLGKLSEQLAAIEGLNLPAELEKLNELVSTVHQLGIQLAAVEKYQELIQANADALDVFKKEVEGKYATSVSVAEEIKKAIQDLADKKYVGDEISNKIAAALQENGAIGQAISNALEDYVDEEHINMIIQHYIRQLDLDGRLNEVYSLVARLHGNLVTLIAHELRSLVFWPDLYVGGIEATEYGAMRYTPMVTATAATYRFNAPGGVQCEIDLEKSPANQWNYVAGPARNEEVYAPVETVQYHMNPASAVIDSWEDLSFELRDVEYVTRSNDSRLDMTIVENGMELRQGSGVLKVDYKINNMKDVIRDNSYDNADNRDGNNKTEASVFALSVKVRNTNAEFAQYGDTTITSDYAMMYISELTPQAIAYNDDDVDAKACLTTTNPDELWPTVQLAIENAPTLPVAWNGQIDLKEHLQTHYNWASETSNQGVHKVWAYGDEAKYGLHYDYALVQYKAGDNVTSDSKYVEQDVTSGIIRPANVDAEGETVNKPNMASVGRHPLVRVRLLDGYDNVVLVGFIKLEITRENRGPLTAGPFAKDANFGCDDAVVDVKWSEISAEILSQLNISKTDFELLYEFDAAATGIGYQFAAAGSETPLTAANTIYGQVSEKQDATGTTTSVLQWTLTMNDMQRIYQGSNDHSKSIWVRYKSKNNDSEHDPVYVQLKVTVHKPAGYIETKIEQYWYSDGSTRLNVAYPRDGQNTRYFIVDLNQVWEGNMPVFGWNPEDRYNPAPAGGFPSYTGVFANQGVNRPTGGYKYYFTAQNDEYELPDPEGGSAEGYRLYVDNTKATDILGTPYPVNYDNTLKYALQANTGVYTNTTLYAGRNRTTATPIATINQTTGEITYERTAAAQFLLNLYGHNNAQLIVHIGVVPYTQCGIAMATDGNEYPARILRPIDVTKKDKNEFKDAEANGSKLYIADLLDFNDWRGEKFVDGNDYRNCWLFAYYGVSGVKVLVDEITTDMNGHDIDNDLLSRVTSQVKITQIDRSGTDVTRIGVTFNLSAYNSAVQGTAATYNNQIKELLGKIMYVNNGNNVKDFNVRIPIEITYDWSNLSPLTVYVDCKIKGTLGNN